MKSWAYFSIQFTGAALAFALVAAPVSVYLFGEYEPAWGKGGSTQVLWWIAIGWALIGIFSSAIGAAAARRPSRVPKLLSLTAGAVFFPITYELIAWLARVAS